MFYLLGMIFYEFIIFICVFNKKEIIQKVIDYLMKNIKFSISIKDDSFVIKSRILLY